MYGIDHVMGLGWPGIIAMWVSIILMIIGLAGIFARRSERKTRWVETQTRGDRYVLIPIERDDQAVRHHNSRQ